MCIKIKKLGWKETHRIQNTGMEDLQGNITVHQIQVLNI
jgi:hypothetical protein